MAFSLKHKDIYFAGIILLGIGLPLSMFIMSISQFILLGNWMIEGRIKEKMQSFLTNKVALSIVSIFLLHLIGLLYTTNFQFALQDLRIKLPLLILPIIFSSSPKLSIKQLYTVFYFFIAGIGTGTLIAMYNYTQIDIAENPDARDLITSISHIRFSLMLALAIFMLAKFIMEKNEPIQHSLAIKFLFGVLLLWFVSFMVILEAITGFAVTVITITVLAGIFVFRQKKRMYSILGLVVIVGIPLSIAYYLHHLYKQWFIPTSINITMLDEHTANGNLYKHEPTINAIENGNYVDIYVCEKELQKEWEKKSSIPFYSKDTKNQYIRITIMRFLTSKDLRKDSLGLNTLSDKEIKAIENGTANVMYMNRSSFKARVHQILWEVNMFMQNGNPNAHSLLQRIEYMKAALALLKKHPLIGVGTGDIRDAFNQHYDETESRLKPEWRNRTHNQYLSMGVAFGLLGMLWFILVLIYPLCYSDVRKDFFYIVFFTIIVSSMLTEDTLETQAGITFFVFFQCLLLLSRKSALKPLK